MEIVLELKLIADVGFVGLPNAGKSTLSAALTPNQVKIGSYPFTTLKPNISFIEYEDYSRIFLADIPGIIKDAHQGRGLGLEFLKHIERSKILVYIIDTAAVDGRDPFEDFLLLQNEIRSYDSSLLERPFFVLLNKMDCIDTAENFSQFKEKYPYPRETMLPISALNESGMDEIRDALFYCLFPEKLVTV